MEKVDTFEEFIGLLSGLNRKKTPLMVNSFYIIDDEKQRGKMTEEFYAAVKKLRQGRKEIFLSAPIFMN